MQKLSLLTFVLLLMSLTTTTAQTIVSENIAQNTTWSKQNGPYILKEEIRILEDYTLTIESGTVIKIDNTSSFTDMFDVRGSLLALGTATEPIVFTHFKDDMFGGDSNNDGAATIPEANSWGGINVNSNDTKVSNFEYCLFRYGGYEIKAQDAALELGSGDHGISNCTFYKCNVGLSLYDENKSSVNNLLFEECLLAPISISLVATSQFNNIQYLNNSYNVLGIVSSRYENTTKMPELIQRTIAGFSNIPYMIYRNSLKISAGLNFTIEPGVVIKVNDADFDNMMEIEGQAIFQGTSNSPIIFTDIQDDSFGGDSNTDGNLSFPEPGDWGGIEITGEGTNNSTLSYCHFRYGGKLIKTQEDACLQVSDSEILIEHCQFELNEVGLSLNAGPIANLSNNTFAQNTIVPLSLGLDVTLNNQNNIFENNAVRGLGLIPTEYTSSAYVLSQITFAGIPNTPYIIYDEGLVIGANSTLEIEAGVIIKAALKDFEDLMIVKGSIIAEGTLTNKIYFTDIKDDSVGGDSNNDGSATTPEIGNWQSIIFSGPKNQSKVNHCEFKFGGTNFKDETACLTIVDCSPEIKNSLFYKTEIGLAIDGSSNPIIESNTIQASSIMPLIMSPEAKPETKNNILINNENNGIGLIPKSLDTGNEINLTQRNFGGIENISYIIFESGLEIKNGTTLNVAPGVNIKIAESTVGSIVEVEGTLNLIGINEQPIIITDLRDDNFGGDTDNNGSRDRPSKGEWDGILFKEASGNSSEISHCKFYHGGKSNFNKLSGVLKIENCNPKINNCEFAQCEYALGLSNNEEVILEDLLFMNNDIGLVHYEGENNLTISSTTFQNNNIGIRNENGNFKISNSTFKNNRTFDLENLSDSQVDARSNWWGLSEYNLINDSANQNLENIFDRYDDADKGEVLLNPSRAPENNLVEVIPDRAIMAEGTSTHSFIGGPINNNSRVILKRKNSEIAASNIETISNIELKATFNWTGAEAGFYDAYLINGSDSTVLKYALNLMDVELINFNEWTDFSVLNGTTYCAGVNVPEIDELFVLMRKKTKIGYSSTWQSKLRLGFNGQELEITDNLVSNSHSDLDKHCIDPTPGFYFFEIESIWKEGDGEIIFTDSPPVLELGEWTQGSVQRPYGQDWKKLSLFSNQSELNIKTEGYGLWSTIEVFYEHLDNPTQYWIFDDFPGNSQNVTIENPKRGDYFVRYTDSAVLLAAGVGATTPTQERQYLIKADTEAIVDSIDLALNITGLSACEFGAGPVSFDIYGAGFDTLDNIYLENNGEVISPKSQNLLDQNTWQVSFDLSTTAATEYNVNINNATEEAQANKKLLIEPQEEPQLWTNIISNSQVRLNRWNKVIIEVGNDSNVDQYMIPLFIKFKNNPEIKEDDIYFSMPQTVKDTAQIDWDLFEGYNSWEELPNYVDLEEDGVSYRVLSFLVNTVPANSKSTFEFQVKYLEGQDYGVQTILLDPLGDSDEFLKSSSSNCAVSLLSNILLPQLGSAINCAANIGKFTFSLAKPMIFPNEPKQKQGLIPAFKYLLLATNTINSCLTAVGQSIPGIGTILSLISAASSVHDVLSVCGKDPGFRELLGYLVGSVTPEDKYGIAGAEKKANTPIEEKDNFINYTGALSYQIDYWNKEDATAPAAEVFIRDTLDHNFDLTTFNFTEVGFLEWTVPLQGGHFFKVAVDMRPQQNYIVEIEGSLDPFTREVYWVHRALDPDTRELPEDPFGGYLPPIDPDWFNLGWVKFDIHPNAGLPSGTLFENQARVNFDGVGVWGPAPPYGPYRNTYDFDPPTSQVDMLAAMSDSLNFEVSWTGDDGEGCGIDYYEIYVSENDNSYELWKIAEMTTSAIFAANPGSSYKFYSVATDKVGNKELIPDIEDASTLVTSVNDQALGTFKVYQNKPNPASDNTEITFDLPKAGPVRLEIYKDHHLLGTPINKGLSEGRHVFNLNTSNYNSGLYYYRISAGQYTRTKKMLIIK